MDIMHINHFQPTILSHLENSNIYYVAAAAVFFVQYECMLHCTKYINIEGSLIYLMDIEVSSAIICGHCTLKVIWVFATLAPHTHDTTSRKHYFGSMSNNN